MHNVISQTQKFVYFEINTLLLKSGNHHQSIVFDIQFSKNTAHFWFAWLPYLPYLIFTCEGVCKFEEAEANKDETGGRIAIKGCWVGCIWLNGRIWIVGFVGAAAIGKGWLPFWPRLFVLQIVRGLSSSLSSWKF